MSIRTTVLLAVLASVAATGCMPVRKGPKSGATPTGEALWVKATTERISYTVKEKVGETVHKDASGNVIGTSDSYQDRVATQEYTYWYPMQGDRQISDDDFFRIAGDQEAFIEDVQTRNSARRWRKTGTYLMVGGGVGLVAAWLIPTDNSQLTYAISLTSVLAACGGYYGYWYGTARLAPEHHVVDMDRAGGAADRYNKTLGLDAPAVLHGGSAKKSVGLTLDGTF